MENTNRSLILHIPHSATRIPEKYRKDFLLNDDELQQELLAMTDRYTDELFPGNYPRAVFPVSRLVCDPERFSSDEEEPMSRVGMGCIYTHGSTGALIRPTSDREVLLKTFYFPHHRRLEALTEEALSRSGCCLILDCHSFSPTPLPYEPDQRMPRPDVCIGTDAFHTPKVLEENSAAFFRRAGLSVSVNSPYGGALVPTGYYQQDSRVQAIMVEINRALYMDDAGNRTQSFQELQQLLRRFCGFLAGVETPAML